MKFETFLYNMPNATTMSTHRSIRSRSITSILNSISHIIIRAIIGRMLKISIYGRRSSSSRSMKNHIVNFLNRLDVPLPFILSDHMKNNFNGRNRLNHQDLSTSRFIGLIQSHQELGNTIAFL